MKTSLPFHWRLALSLSLAVMLAGSARAQIGPSYALSFDGVDDYVSVPHNASLNVYPLTISAWVKTSRNAAVVDGVLSKYIDASANGYSLFLHNGRIRGFYFRDSANYVWDGSLGLDGGVIADGAWHHVAFVVDAAGGRLLVDGVVRATLPWTGIPGATTSTVGFQIGRYWAYDTAFLGQIDEVHVWNMALTTAQIQAKMHQRLTGSEPNLAAYWRGHCCCDPCGQVLDDSGHGNHGLFINGPRLVLSGVPFAPEVATWPATMVTYTSATLNGSFKPNNLVTTPFFQWGTTTNYEGGTIGGVSSGGNNAIPWSYNLTGLTSNVVYRFRLGASNSAGTNFGADTIIARTPRCISASAPLTLANIVVRFSEFVGTNSAEDEFNYRVSGSTVAMATMNADGMSVTLTLGLPLNHGTTYEVTIENVTGLAGDVINPNPCTLSFRAPVISCGFLVFQAYRPESTTDNNLDRTLLADPNFPSKPNEVLYMSAFDTRTVYPNDSHEGYGALIFGNFIPPSSGNWIFYLRSDDSSRLFLNPNGSDAAGKIMIQEETGCCGPFSAHASAPQALTAGQSYYIEAIYKEGMVGDYCQVAAKLDTDPTNPDTLRPIPGAYLSAPADTAGASLVITQQPVDQPVVLQGGQIPPPATFTVAVSANRTPVFYQWYRDNGFGFRAIIGANSATYSLLPVCVDNGARFRVQVYIPGAGVISSIATLRLVPIVTNTNDDGAGSLRQAICVANNLDRIIFAPGVIGKIRLTTGELFVNKPLSILGPGAAQLAMSGNTNSRVFHIGPQGNVDISGLTITEGLVQAPQAPSAQPGTESRGAGVFNEGSLRLFDCMLTTNKTQGGSGGNGRFDGSNQGLSGGPGGSGKGAAIYNSGSLALTRCTLVGNRALGGDGGRGVDALAGSQGSGGGGGEGEGGAIWSTAITRLENCTLADNRVVGGRGGNPGSDQFDNDAPPGTGGNGLGGALQGPFVLESCTIAGNAVTGGLGGQGYSLTGAPGAAGGGGVNAPGAQSIHNSIVAGNTGSASSPDVSGTVTSQGWNLIGITNGSSGWTASDLKGSAAAPLDPKLGPVQDNGGLTPTIALLSGSPAIDQGKSSGLTTDQRGRPRSFDWPSVVNAAGGDGSDIGAFERGPPALSITRSGNQVLLSWPASELVFRLQGADTLPAGNTWASVPGNPVLSGGIYQITRNISGASKFYRLINP